MDHPKQTSLGPTEDEIRSRFNVARRAGTVELEDTLWRDLIRARAEAAHKAGYGSKRFLTVRPRDLIDYSASCLVADLTNRRWGPHPNGKAQCLHADAFRDFLFDTGLSQGKDENETIPVIVLQEDATEGAQKKVLRALWEDLGPQPDGRLP